MKYKLFISDFDGTLVRADGTVSEKNKRAIAAYRRAGGIFAVATGRMTSSILPRLKELGIGEGVVSAYQGAVVTELKTGKILHLSAFPHEDAIEIISLLLRGDYHVHVYTKDAFYCNRDDEGLKNYERICGVKGMVEEDLIKIAEKYWGGIVKCLVMTASEDRERVEEELCAALGEKYYVTNSSEFLVEILPKGQSKAQAVEFFEKYYGIARERIAAIGDRENDIPLVECAGGRFAVANAEDALKKIAVVVPSCEEDGVAYAIERYAMEEESHE